VGVSKSLGDRNVMRRNILHLCADLGADSRFYQLDDNYNVFRIGIRIGVENFIPRAKYHGVIANPKCTEFSTADGFHKIGDLEQGMVMVNDCLRIIKQADPEWWMLENPAKGRLREFLGEPVMKYQPWQYGSPWTKETALWGKFKIPPAIVLEREDVVLRHGLYIRKRDTMPSLALLHKSAIQHMPEFDWCKESIKCDADLRSLCSPGFAQAFKLSNP